jgi:hypothetical protein
VRATAAQPNFVISGKSIGYDWSIHPRQWNLIAERSYKANVGGSIPSARTKSRALCEEGRVPPIDSER